MKKRILAIAAIISIATTESLSASECDAIRDCGVESVGNPYLAQVTCYCEPGRKTATGSSRQEGIIAGPPEWIGAMAAVYEVECDGSIGDFIDLYPIEDTGYGASISVDGYRSDILTSRRPGTVETGITLDFRKKSESDCYDFMLETYTGRGTTGSQVWVQIIRGDG